MIQIKHIGKHADGCPSVRVTADTSREEIAALHLIIYVLEEWLERNKIPSPLIEEVFPSIIKKAEASAECVAIADAIIAKSKRELGIPRFQRMK